MATNTFFKDKTYDEIVIDFQVLPTQDPRILSVYDLSTWGHIADKPAVIEIYTPAEKDPVVLPYTKCAINTFNSVNLYLNCGDCGKDDKMDLPDGIYEITLKGSPSYFSKSIYYLRTTLTQLELDRIYINLDVLNKNPKKEILQKITDIEMLLRSAEANVKFENIDDAHQMFMEAQKLIEEMRGCLNCR